MSALQSTVYIHMFQVCSHSMHIHVHVHTCTMFVHANTFSLRVLEEHIQAVHKVCSIEGISADANTEGLPQIHVGGLPHCLVGQGT